MKTKMAAVYADIGSVSKLDAGFQQISILQIFWNFQNIFV